MLSYVTLGATNAFVRNRQLDELAAILKQVPSAKVFVDSGADYSDDAVADVRRGFIGGVGGGHFVVISGGSHVNDLPPLARALLPKLQDFKAGGLSPAQFRDEPNRELYWGVASTLLAKLTPALKFAPTAAQPPVPPQAGLWPKIALGVGALAVFGTAFAVFRFRRK